MIYLTTCARLLAEANGGDYARWLDLLHQAVAARELAAPRGGSAASMLPGGVSYIPMGGDVRTPVAGFIRWCEQCGYSLQGRQPSSAPRAEQAAGPREAQVRRIEAAARALGYGACLLAIPYGGKAKIRAECGDLPDDSFKRAWRVADEQGRLRVANKWKYQA